MDREESISPKALMEQPEAPYVPHDVLDETAKTALVGLGSGFFLAAVRNAMSRRNVGAMGVFTRGAPIMGICGTESLQEMEGIWRESERRLTELPAQLPDPPPTPSSPGP